MISLEDEEPNSTDLRIHIQKLKDHRIDRNKKQNRTTGNEVIESICT
jgi:hypothetical protein